jgi:hypothetical protein
MSIDNRQRPPPADSNRSFPVLIVVEGPNDVQFLRRISRVLNSHNAALPDLAGVEQQGEVVFVPLGGGGVAAWADRLAPLGLPEFHLLDQELPPETEIRRAIVEKVNQRSSCYATLTRKRSVENYQHPRALELAGGTPIEFGDFDSLPELVAKASYDPIRPCPGSSCPAVPGVGSRIGPSVGSTREFWTK